MPKVKNVEKKILEKEGFEVQITKNGKDVRGDKILPIQYKVDRKSKGDMTVKEWKEARFSMRYPGYGVNVLDSNGKPVSGQTKLCTIRKSYNE